MNLYARATANACDEDQLREIIREYRDRWLEEDEENHLRICREVAEETCYAVLDEQLESQVQVK